MILDLILYVLLFAVLAGAGFVGYVFLTGQLSGFGGGTSLFGPKPERRLDVVEQMTLDARRRLVLIRRDDVEHLIMTGGPVDVVIETGIGDPVAAGAAGPGSGPGSGSGSAVAAFGVPEGPPPAYGTAPMATTTRLPQKPPVGAVG